MKHFIFILSVILFSCQTKTSEKHSIHFFYYPNSPAAGSTDTLNYNKFNTIHPDVKLKNKHNFILDGVQHNMKTYYLELSSDSLKTEYVTLDSLGVVFAHDPATNASIFLYSNNDSINRLITRTFSELISAKLN